MKRSIYSLALMDAVVEAVDRRAQEMQTSRSNLVNQILAEYLQCETPEMRIRKMLSEMSEQMEMQAQRVQQFRSLEQSARMLTLQSTVPYQYRPTAQYTVELYRIPKDGEAGRLRVQVRTRNQVLLRELEQFFRMWASWESRFVIRNYRLEPGRMERSLCSPVPGKAEVFGTLTAEYIRSLDGFLKAYLNGEQGLEEAFVRKMTEQPYFV